MTTRQAIELSPVGAADLVRTELAGAGQALHDDDLNAAFDRYVRALGLGLQLGPAPTGQVLAALLQTARELALGGNAEGLSALGPALVGLVNQVREAGALPPTAVMEAWATFAADLGALIGQLGLALGIPPDHRTGMIDHVRRRAILLDEATDGHFALTAWVDELGLAPPGI